MCIFLGECGVDPVIKVAEHIVHLVPQLRSHFLSAHTKCYFFHFALFGKVVITVCKIGKFLPDKMKQNLFVLHTGVVDGLNTFRHLIQDFLFELGERGAIFFIGERFLNIILVIFHSETAPKISNAIS